MSAYLISSNSMLLDATDNAVGIVGIDGREWLFPAALTTGTEGAVVLAQTEFLFDSATNVPVGILSNGREYVFAAPFILNTTIGLRLGKRSTLISSGSGQPLGIRGGGSSFAFPVPPVLNGSTGGGLVDNAEIALLGDSIQNYTNAVVSISGATITRDTNGLVTISKTGFGTSILGNGSVYLVNVLPTSLMVVGDGAYVDANTYTIQTSITGAPLLSTDVTINPSVSALTIMAQFSGRGIFYHVLSAFKGSVKLKGNFGQQSDTSEQMADATAKAWAAVAPGHFVLDLQGINNLAPKGADDVTTAVNARMTNLNNIVSNGRRVLVCALKPVGYGFPSYQTLNTNIQAFNTAMQAKCDGVNLIWCDTFTTTWDSAGSTNVSTPGTPCAYTYTVTAADFLHPVEIGSQLDSVPVIAELTPRIIAHDLLPKAYNDTSPVPWASYQRIVGPYTAAPGWTTATTGFLTNGSGTRPTAPFNWNTGSLAGSPTAVMSIQGTDTVRVVHTATAANDKTQTFFDGNVSGVTLATLGLAAGDKFRLGVKLSWQNYRSSNCELMALTCTASVFANGVGLMLLTQLEPNLQFESDSGSKYVWTGVMVVPASAISSTAFTPKFLTQFSAASGGNSLITDFTEFAWQKVTGVV